ncbi:hypothetical protein D3C73_1526400 [compost metagenome]
MHEHKIAVAGDVAKRKAVKRGAQLRLARLVRRIGFFQVSGIAQRGNRGGLRQRVDVERLTHAVHQIRQRRL